MSAQEPLTSDVLPEVVLKLKVVGSVRSRKTGYAVRDIILGDFRLSA